MPAETTISTDDDTRDRLDHYRSDDHYSMTEVLESMMDVLPTIERFQQGCAHCGKEPAGSYPADDDGGVIQYVNPLGGPHGVFYFCSTECAEKENEKWSNYIPEYPDLVLVGGHEEEAVELRHATFYFDGETKEVGCSIPGAFSGTNDSGHEYAYVGEPVYVKNSDEWVQEGVIKTVIHEDHRTSLLLGPGNGEEFEALMSNHPSDERREAWQERRGEAEAEG